MTDTLNPDRQVPSFSAAPLPPTAPVQDFLTEARELLRLAGPVVITQLAQMGIGTIDVLMLGAYSKDALAASALGLSLYYAMWVLAMGPAVAVQPMIAHILGARAVGQRVDVRGVRLTVRISL